MRNRKPAAIAMAFAMALGCVGAGSAMRAGAAEETPQPSIHVYSDPNAGVTLEMGKALAPKDGRMKFGHDKRPDKGRGVVLFYGKADGEEWQELSFTFKAAKGGKAMVKLRGDHWRESTGQPWAPWYVLVDDLSVKVDGRELIANGNMEDGPIKRPTGWSGRSAGGVVQIHPDARSGKRCAKVSVKKTVFYDVELETGKTYTVSAWFRVLPDGKAPAAKKSFKTK